MRKLTLLSLAAAGLLAAGAAQAIPAHVCEGPAGARNPHCQPQPDRAVPEPGAAAAFALGAGLIALRTRRARG